MSLNHSWFLSSSIPPFLQPSLFSGLITSKSSIIFLHVSLIQGGKLTSLLTIFWKSLSLFLWTNGGIPTVISYIRHPNDQRSTGYPCPDLFMISGANYSGVPQKLLVSYISFILHLLSPKSVILHYPSESISTFSGFKSRYKTSFLCR